MAIKRTAKYLAAVAAARELGLMIAVRHDWDIDFGNPEQAEYAEENLLGDYSKSKALYQAAIDALNALLEGGEK